MKVGTGKALTEIAPETKVCEWVEEIVKYLPENIQNLF